MAGIINGTTSNKKIMGISCLKGGGFLEDEIKKYLGDDSKEKTNWKVLTDYHFGGYGKVTKDLIDLIMKFERDHNLPLDPVYTGKAMAALIEEIKKGSFTRRSTILFLHTGGLQGRDTLLK
jgi:1-aminocyclopropane-1-carboxylate deaminase